MYLVHDLTKRILQTPMSLIEKSEVRIRNLSLFIVERFHLLIQMKSILLF